MPGVREEYQVNPYMAKYSPEALPAPTKAKGSIVKGEKHYDLGQS